MDIAGTGTTTYSLFREDVNTFQEAWKAHMVPKYFADIAFRAADYNELPSFVAERTQAANLLNRSWPSMGFILLMSILLFGLGFSRYRHHGVIEG